MPCKSDKKLEHFSTFDNSNGPDRRAGIVVSHGLDIDI